VLATALTGGVGIAILLAGQPAPAPTSAASLLPSSRTDVSCRRDTQTLPPLLATDPCPSALIAVELAVAPVRLPIQRIAIEAGNLTCELLWPGVQTPAPCYPAPYQAGQYMHAWVSFTGSTKVAVVVLGLDLPTDLEAPGTTRPPWITTVLAVASPPPGWVMP
jgi:hypothetical protein